MRVLLLHERFHPDTGGGGEYVALRRAQGLIEAGHEVEVLTPGDPSVKHAEGVPTRRVAVPRSLFLTAFPKIAAAAASADLVHCFTYYAALPAYLAARRADRPVVCEQLAVFGSVWREMRGVWKGTTIELFERFLLRLPMDGRVYLSDFSANLAESCGARSKQSTVITPGIDPVVSTPTENKRASGVLFAGQFSIRKGFDRLLALATRLPSIPFTAVGWRDGENWPQDLPENLHIIEGRGQVYRDALERASVLFMPSRAESFGLVIYEAMAHGCSIVSTIPGDYAGLFISPWNEDEAVAALKARIQDPALAIREAKDNRKRAEMRSWTTNTSLLLEFYSEILSERGKPDG